VDGGKGWPLVARELDGLMRIVTNGIIGWSFWAWFL
jgi:hypothetical protein